jgi:hypothetical protein
MVVGSHRDWRGVARPLQLIEPFVSEWIRQALADVFGLIRFRLT